MDFDTDIAPFMEQMNESMQKIQCGVLPLFSSLDEDSLVANYNAEEQARICLSTAYALLSLTRALDQLNGGSAKLPPGAEKQMEHKMDRITESIRKLRDHTRRIEEKEEEETNEEDTEEPPRKRTRGNEEDKDADPLGDKILFGLNTRGRGRVAVEAVQRLADRVKGK